MAILTERDIALIKAQMREIINENPVSIIIRRDQTTLAAQTVRVGRREDLIPIGIRTEEARSGITVLGEIGLDIQAGDRFTLDGFLYRVTHIRQDQTVAVQAVAQMVQ